MDENASFGPVIYGHLTRELYNAWKERAEAPHKRVVRSLRYLFYDMELYPSSSQVHEMIECANDCSKRRGGDFLRFGEFCVYAAELKASYESRLPRPAPLSKCESPHRRNLPSPLRNCSNDGTQFEVFLGGSCNPTTWRTDVAIPMLKNLGITYYNPVKPTIKQVAHWGPELIELENKAKQNAEVLFFVIDNQTRSVASQIEASHVVGSQRKLILVIHEFPGPGAFVLGEAISEKEYRDLKQGQSFLHDLVERQGIPVFDQVPVALACSARLLKEDLWPQDLTREDNANPVKMGHIKLGDKLIKLREVFDSLDMDSVGYISLSDVRLGFRIVTREELSVESLRIIAEGHVSCSNEEPGPCTTVSLDDIHLNFDQFCCIITEFRSNCDANKKVMEALAAKLSTLLVQPLSRFVDWLWRPFESSPVNGFAERRPKKVDIPFQAVCRDVFLGGCGAPTTWRQDVAIPLLKKSGLTYFSPQQGFWGQRMIPLEAAAIENSRLLLFAITRETRSLAPMVLAAHYVGLGCNVVLCIQFLEEEATIEGEKSTQEAVKDYNRGRVYLSDLATRAGVPVFEDLQEAVVCAVNKCVSRRPVQFYAKH